MKALFYRIPRKVRLALSVALLLASVYHLWALLSFGMPTPGLAVRKAEAELGLPRGTWSTTALLSEAKYGNSSSWRLSRRGDDFYVALPVYNTHFNFLWEADFRSLSPLCPQQLFLRPAPDRNNPSVLRFYLVSTPNPDTVRVELIQNGQTVNCVETAPGSGFWVGEVHSSESDNTSPLARAYDADGNLIGSSPP